MAKLHVTDDAGNRVATFVLDASPHAFLYGLDGRIVAAVVWRSSDKTELYLADQAGQYKAMVELQPTGPVLVDVSNPPKRRPVDIACRN